ncbi:MAG: hypothetical protein AABY93_08475 [Bacteroidota bacterium]
MQLKNACLAILDQLTDVVRQIDEKDFCKPSETLSQSTVGQHLRHTVEFFICLEQGFRKGLVNYDKREHDKLIESDKFIALAAIERIKDFVSNQTKDQVLQLEVGYDRHTDDCLTISTNYFRELTYNIEHAVHHMAIMKIGIREVASYVKMPSDFGVAVSTIRYKESGMVTSR